MDSVENKEDIKKNTEESRRVNIDSSNEVTTLDERVETLDSTDNVENIMKNFLNKDPKIGVWSYPAFLVLQYLYNTKPGFKMSRVAKDALEYGLKHMYPELFEKAKKISEIKFR
ncbi:hypothetical protein DFR86_02085 [Acidianus sulfidivorans JP7]|uniref:Uncharacterized protein n=1 Tax=Acidianus sulfidivorans JP7 TaxID=619593 RepID=A0A2U9IQ58_9CREN|nr:hypothetical protein DFR86_02085 [Acidianus sulfidivorans JP7]